MGPSILTANNTILIMFFVCAQTYVEIMHAFCVPMSHTRSILYSRENRGNSASATWPVKPTKGHHVMTWDEDVLV